MATSDRGALVEMLGRTPLFSGLSAKELDEVLRSGSCAASAAVQARAVSSTWPLLSTTPSSHRASI